MKITPFFILLRKIKRKVYSFWSFHSKITFWDDAFKLCFHSVLVKHWAVLFILATSSKFQTLLQLCMLHQHTFEVERSYFAFPLIGILSWFSHINSQLSKDNNSSHHISWWLTYIIQGNAHLAIMYICWIDSDFQYTFCPVDWIWGLWMLLNTFISNHLTPYHQEQTGQYAAYI